MQIGDRVKDSINGFGGIVTGKTEYINGCRQFLVKPEALGSDGKVMDGIWIDEQNLTVVFNGVLPNPFTTASAPLRGGPDRTERAR